MVAQKNSWLGLRVTVVAKNAMLNGKQGTVTSVGNEVCPIHVTLDRENYETDFKEKELVIDFLNGNLGVAVDAVKKVVA